jgi:hypothetical protein
MRSCGRQSKAFDKSIKNADDNTLSYSYYDLNNVISKLESDSQNILDWFLQTI